MLNVHVPRGERKSGQKAADAVPQMHVPLGRWVVPQQDESGQQLGAHDAASEQQLGKALSGHVPDGVELRKQANNIKQTKDGNR